MSQQPIEKVLEALRQQAHLTERRLLQMGREIALLRYERALLLAGRTPKFPIEFRSQFGEDLTLRDLLGEQIDGFYIEVGAHDGVDLSVSYAFEAIGWKGLLIEAIPAVAEACKKNRPNSRVVQTALSYPGAAPTATFSVVDGNPFLSYLGQTPPPGEAPLPGTRTQITVPVTTMDKLLEGHEGPIDFAVIDVEGTETDVLKGFDLVKHAPRVLIIEDNALLRGGRGPVVDYMASQPYVSIGVIGVNRIYVHKNTTDILRRLQIQKRGHL